MGAYRPTKTSLKVVRAVEFADMIALCNVMCNRKCSILYDFCNDTVFMTFMYVYNLIVLSYYFSDFVILYL